MMYHKGEGPSLGPSSPSSGRTRTSSMELVPRMANTMVVFLPSCGGLRPQCKVPRVEGLGFGC